MTGPTRAVEPHLNALEAALVEHGLYLQERPPESAFASTQPFCLDTMSFPCWLQFVFLEKVRLVIAAGGPLPAPCNIGPMGEAYAQAAHFPQPLIDILLRIDASINNE
ncbi:MAG: YqcC family protein [Litorivicinus sp.]